jgi:FMN phosphatase YigB (HAD superfamily)
LAIRAVSFDFWNTLVTEQPGGFKFYQNRRVALLSDALRSLGVFSDETLEQAFALESESHSRTWREEHRTVPTAERVGQILMHLQVSLPPDIMSGLVNAYEEGILEHPPVVIPGVRESLARLGDRFRLGIISDVGYSPGRILKEVLRREGLIGIFDSLVFSDEAGRSKPNLELFERTAGSLGARPSEIVHIGDLEHTDIVGAKEAGCYAIRFTGATPMSEDELTIADAVTADFRRIPEIIDALNDDLG